jgi:hypothetical protein
MGDTVEEVKEGVKKTAEKVTDSDTYLSSNDNTYLFSVQTGFQEKTLLKQ